MSVPQFSVNPNSILSPGTFNDDSDQWHAELPAFINALNALGITGGVMAIPLIFSTLTADADPTAGKLRLNNATQNISTAIRVDLVDSIGSTWTTVIDSFDDSTSTVKGQIKLVDLDDGTKFLTFNVTAVGAESGYRNITVVNTGGSGANPFTDGAAVLLAFTRTGDKGDTGATGAAGTNGTNGINDGLALISVTSATAVASVDFTGLNGTYDLYRLYYEYAIPASAGNPKLQLKASKDNGSNYLSAGCHANLDTCDSSGAAQMTTQSNAAAIELESSGVSSTGRGVSGVIDFYYSATRYTQLTWNSVQKQTNIVSGRGSAEIDPGATFNVNALRLLFSSGNIASIKCHLYGLRKA